MIAKRLAYTVGIGMIFLFLGSAFAEGPQPGQLTEQEKRGKYIYLRGASPSGREITCFLGDQTTEVPATAMLCASCHGFDGRGNPEGGVTPSDITWEALTKPYGVTHVSGRKHPAYTERTLEVAMSKGIDPAGNRLPFTMPMYSMSREDLADLVAYVKRLGRDLDPGLSDRSIKIGAILPGGAQSADLGLAVKAALEAYFEEVNGQGGVYNRKIELRIAEAATDPASAKASVGRFIDGEQVFALAGAFIAGADKEIISLVEEKEVPTIGPFTLYPETGYPLNRHIFYLFSGLKEQSAALINFAAEKMQKRDVRIAIVSSNIPAATGVAETVEEQFKKRGYDFVSKVTYTQNQFKAAELASKMNEAKTAAVFFLGSGHDAAALMREGDKLKWAPFVLMPGAMAGKDITDAPQSFKDKIFLSFPTLPSDQTQDGVAEYRAMAERHKLPSRHIASQLSAYCAARILVEGMKLAGKQLSREKLIKALEGLYEFDTGLIPPVTFGPNRRIGALGAYIVTIDPEKKDFIPISKWILPD